MKILLLGEYSNVHNTLAMGLRELGHQVTVASNGDFWKNYPRDIDLARKPGKLGGLCLLAKVYAQLPSWKDYDVVQLINPMFLELKAERIRPIYQYLRKRNGKMVLGAYGMDYYWVHECITRKPLRYSDFNFADQIRSDQEATKEINDWIDTPKGQLNQLIAHDCDGIATGLYEYQVCYEPLFPKKTRFIPYPIVPKTPIVPISSTQPLRLFIGISKNRSSYKGTDIMLKAAEDIKAKYADRIILTKAEGLPFDEYQQLMDSSDAILDQLYSYTPAMNALLAMSKGIIVIGGGEPENYEILGEKELRPIINVEPNYESVYNELEQLVLHPERIPELKRQSMEYICRHHDYIKVARRYQDFYQSL